MDLSKILSISGKGGLFRLISQTKSGALVQSLIDGKKVKACIPKISTLAGKSIVTVEGLSEREKEVYVHSFAEAGAVQCGYCIPGMVMSMVTKSG